MFRAALTASILLAVGCATLPTPEYVYPELDADQTFQLLIAESEFGAADDVDVLALSPELRRYLDEQRRTYDIRRRLEATADMFRRNGALGMQYDVNSTLTAAEAFKTRRGNCLTYTHLFIAVARAMDMRVRYQEVLGIQRWDTVGDFVVLNRHIAAYGNFPSSGTFVVDFGQLIAPNRRFGRIVSDDRARAQHFNNLGADALTSGQTGAGIASFNRSIIIDRELSYVWTNLGTAYSRAGRYQDAEYAYAQALRVSAYDISAINQLASLYDRIERPDLAAEYRKLSERARGRNPYYLFRDGVNAMEAGDLDRAVDALRRAAKRQPDEMHFYLQLGKAHAMRADTKQAKKAFLRAEELIATDADRIAVAQMVEEVCSGLVECIPLGPSENPPTRTVDLGGWPWG